MAQRLRVLFHSDTLAEVIILKLPPMGVPSNVHELQYTLEGCKVVVLNKPNFWTVAMARFVLWLALEIPNHKLEDAWLQRVTLQLILGLSMQVFVSWLAYGQTDSIA